MKGMKGATMVGSYNNPLDRYRVPGDPKDIPKSVLIKRKEKAEEAAR